MRCARSLPVTIVFLALGVLVPACSDDSSSSGGGSGTPSAVIFEAGFIGNRGSGSITGTATLPAGAASGRTVQMEVIRVGGLGGNQLGPAGTTGVGQTFTYKVTELEPGDYKIGIRVDQTDDGKVNDPGDYIGFARGTTGAAKKTADAADAITVNGSATEVDVLLVTVE